MLRVVAKQPKFGSSGKEEDTTYPYNALPGGGSADTVSACFGLNNVFPSVG